MASELEELLWFPVGEGDLTFRVKDAGLEFQRSRRLRNASGSKAWTLLLRYEHIRDVRLRSIGGPPTLTVLPTEAAAPFLAEKSWPEDHLQVEVSLRDKSEIYRGFMFIAYRYLVDRLGLRPSAPTSITGLNGTFELMDSRILLSHAGATIDWLQPLVDQSYSADEVVDVHLFEMDTILHLMLLDRIGTEALLGGESDYCLSRSLRLDIGQWPEASSFYETLPRFGDRPAEGLRGIPPESVVLAAYQSYLTRPAAPAASVQPRTDLVDQLQRLADLLASGALSSDEYEAAKRQVLGPSG